MSFNKLFNQVKSLLNKNKTYAILLFLNLISAFGAILIYKLIAESFGSNDTFVFTYLKRIISLIVPISLFGLGVTLSRRVAIDPEKRKLITNYNNNCRIRMRSIIDAPPRIIDEWAVLLNGLSSIFTDSRTIKAR